MSYLAVCHEKGASKKRNFPKMGAGGEKQALKLPMEESFEKTAFFSIRDLKSYMMLSNSEKGWSLDSDSL